MRTADFALWRHMTYQTRLLSARQACDKISHWAGFLKRAMRTKHRVQIDDEAATGSYTEGDPRVVEAVELGGIRTAVGVPMLKEGELIGVTLASVKRLIF